jgi:hypothetical protein
MIDPRLVTGFTLSTYSVGVSLHVRLPSTGVLQREVLSTAGGTLFIMGVTGVAGLGYATPTVPHKIPGGAPLFISAKGATASVNMLEYLSTPWIGATAISG